MSGGGHLAYYSQQNRFPFPPPPSLSLPRAFPPSDIPTPFNRPKMRSSFPLILALFLLFPSKPLPPISSQGIGHPEPKIWIAERHIGQQQFFQNSQPILPFEGQIMVGREYTLVLEMSIIMRWDFLVESCTCNQRGMFLERGGCLRPDGNWLAKQEFRRAQSKFILIHFFAPEPILRIQCQTRVVQCCGCCENFCERLMPPLDPFPSFPVPISCSYPIGLPPPLPPAAQIPSIVAVPGAAVPSPCWLPFLNQCPPTFSIPFWLLVLLICLFFFLALLCLCCLLAQIFLWGWAGGRQFRERIWPMRKGGQEEIHPPPPVPPPPAAASPPPQRIFVVDRSAQTNGFPQIPPNSPPPPIPIPDYEERGGATKEFGHHFEEHHTAIPLRENWPPPPNPWWRSREEFEEREMVEEREEWTEEIVENGRMRGAEGGAQQYENWIHDGAGRNGWTRFGTEPMTRGGGGMAEEEDRFQWRTTTPDGQTQREVDHHRVHWERSAF